MNQLDNLTISKAHQLLKKQEVSSVQLANKYLERIDEVEGHVQALVTRTAELALKQAAEADERITKGNVEPLTGIPCTIKDVICTKDVRTTCSSRMLENFVPPYNANVIERLQSAGMVMLGKANMDEFAMGSTNESSAFFTTRNPWDLSRTPGGSSGGSAASVAAGEAMYSLGSDTGGSLRLPASFCNLVGLKPTYGRVSRYGVSALASSLDQVGPITRTVTDAALVFSAIAGYDERDSNSINQSLEDFTSNLSGNIQGMKIGVPRECYIDGIQPGVKQAFEDAIKQLEDLGAIIDTSASLPFMKYAPAVYYIIVAAEASANLARLDGVKYGYAYTDSENMWEVMEKTRQVGFGPEVKRRLILGTLALSTDFYDDYFVKAQKVRTLICRDFSNAFKKYDALLSPTSPVTAFKLGGSPVSPAEAHLTDVYTLPVNLAGIPALSVPAGFSDGMPTGLQIMAKPLDENTLFKIGYAYEQATGWYKQTPVLPE